MTDGAFRGAARHYDRFRPPYPPELVDDLRAWAGVTGRGRLLDLACGTGELALALHPWFRDVWAVDVEPEMVEVGRAKAARLGAGNVRWTVGRAEDVDAPYGTFELITIGNAFHRMDRRVIAARARDWLIPGGCLAIPNTHSVWAGDEPWQAVAVEVIRRWTDPGAAGPGRRPHIGFLADVGFLRIEEHHFQAPHVWTLDDFVGYLYSTSVVAAIVRAGKGARFEAELRAALLAYDPAGRYPETLRFSTILAIAPNTTLAQIADR
jgi:SAM-dependent methyltransferase